MYNDLQQMIFLGLFKDNSDQSDIQLVADYLRKLELNETVVSAVVALMHEYQSNWTKNDEELINWLNTEESKIKIRREDVL